MRRTMRPCAAARCAGRSLCTTIDSGRTTTVRCPPAASASSPCAPNRCPAHSTAQPSPSRPSTRASRKFASPMKLATKRLRGRRYSVSGSPICSIRPEFMTTTWSDMVSASSWSWVTNRKVLPVWDWIDFSSICIWWRSLASSADRGSSSSSTCGSGASARISAIRWRCPPDSSPGWRSPNSSRWTSASRSRTRRAIASRGTARISSPKAMLRAALRWGNSA